MPAVELGLGLFGAVVRAAVAPPLQIPYPILLVLGGLAVGFTSQPRPVLLTPG